jgi:hypothetical protein
MGARMGRTRSLLVALAAAVAACAGGASAARASISFQNPTTGPNIPNLPGVTLNGQAQTINAQMGNWGVNQTILSSGWNVTVNGDASAGHSAVFKIYCPGPSACGPDPVGYLAGGATMPANSLTLNSTGATFGGIGLPLPSHQCNSGCNVDSAAAVKVASAGALVIGTATTSGYSTTSLALSVPTTLRRPLQSGEVYNVDLIWTLNSGP